MVRAAGGEVEGLVGEEWELDMSWWQLVNHYRIVMAPAARGSERLIFLIFFVILTLLGDKIRSYINLFMVLGRLLLDTFLHASGSTDVS